MAVDAVRTGEIRARDLGRRFEIRSFEVRSLKETILRRNAPQTRDLWALRGVDLDVAPGEAVGIVGENGSGKSTLLKLLARIFAPTEGTIEVGGRVGSLLELGAGFHPDFTGVENVYLNAAVHGLSRRYVNEHLADILAFAELEEFAHMPVKTYSSGMYMRLGFAVAIHVNPDVLLLDEVLAVGDEGFQRKCHGRIWDFKHAGGTIVFVSHDLAAVEQLCDRAVLLEHGRVAEDSAPRNVIRTYHRRLAEGAATPAEAESDGDARSPCRITGVRALDGDGVSRDRFVEAEQLVLESELYAVDPVRDAQLVVGVREVSGRPVGSQAVMGIDLSAGEALRVRLNVPSIPMRDGRFVVDVGLLASDGRARLAELERAVELTVFSDSGAADGPIRLGGSWEVEAAEARLSEPARR